MCFIVSDTKLVDGHIKDIKACIFVGKNICIHCIREAKYVADVDEMIREEE